MSTSTSSIRKYTVVIIGAGAGGTAVAARLRNIDPSLDIAIIDPSQYHYYQPAWSLVGAGAYKAEATRRTLKYCLPEDVVYIPTTVNTLLPDESGLILKDGTRLGYDFLVIAAGMQINWDAIDGLESALGKNGVTSNYRYDLAPYTWELVRNFKGGNAIYTQPTGAVKCPGAPQKALYLAADHFRKQGLKAQLQFHTAGPAIFGVPFYSQALEKIMDAYQTQVNLGSNLVQVRGPEKIAVFESVNDGQTIRREVAYELLHVVPPQSAPDFIRNSVLADAAGWLEVDKHTLRHTRYASVFGLGDCTSTPNSKTAAAIRSQAPVLVENLLQALAGRVKTVSYDGYAACPLTTSLGKVMLAEFTYGGVIAPSFAADPRLPRRFYWWLKRSFLPFFYWNFMLKGRYWPMTHKAREFPVDVPFVEP